MGIDYGVLVTDIEEDSPAEEAGIITGDVILAIDSEKVASEDEIEEFIENKAGESVALTILRAGNELILNAKLGNEKKKDGNVNVFIDGGDFKGLGLGILIPIIAIIMTLLIPITAIYFDYRKRAMISKERMAAIEKGIELPTEATRTSKIVTSLDTLRRGFICLGIGAALVIYSVVAKEIEEWNMGAGLILLFIGLALVIWYRIAAKKES
ncbi:MAG: PDZ domain-containing protein [Candidatus Stahlbacteria bacterium]|nr:PDZ domain-containing protein [Candidatus Stahlbacteria bacterium]